jgi:murein DD-endopeptidase MepM/ murein hydrolase activator NlpD
MRLLKLAVLVLGAFAAAVLLVVSLRVGAAPTLALRASGPAIGARTEVVVEATAPGRGLSGIRVEIEQAGRTHVLADRSYRPLAPWAWSGPRTQTDSFKLDVGRSAWSELREGEAVVRVVARRAPTWLRHPGPVVKELRLPVRLVPPPLSLRSTQNYVSQGGAGVVTYRVGPSAVRDGVRAGSWFFPGAPLPGGGEGDRLALFGVPWDLSDPDQLRIEAEDDAGNRTEVAFVDRFFPKPPVRDRIELTDPFMQRVVPEILQQTPDLADKGDLLQNYLEINRQLRRSDGAALVELARHSTPRFLWTQPFLALPNAKVMSAFADHRTYFYRGREVDQQTHLGFDLAATAHDPVPAANRGVVLLARYFGIFGNAVVLDHGYGLMTLYGHLSSIDVKEGQQVERGQILGRTGATGLAGGDHLHYTTLVRGLPVNPAEWWDPHWIRDRVARKLGPALRFEDERAGS